MDEIVIVAAKRTPIGNFNGVFIDIPSPQLCSAAISQAVTELSINTAEIDGAYLGCVLSAGIGQAPARQAVLQAKLPTHTPCTTINKMCGSGMEAVILAHNAILGGSHQLMIAGGMENMSRAPYLMLGARQGYRFGHQKLYDHMLLDGLEDAYEKGRHMGSFAEVCAEKYHISRAAQDRFALESITRARTAIEQGWFKSEIAPVAGVAVDEGPYSVNPEKIPKLRPVFQENGTITAANASSLSDGAAILMLCRRSHAQKLGLKPLASIVGHYSYAQEPAWFSTAPIYAIQGLIKKIAWKMNEIDLFEINEAFAVVTLVAIQELKLNRDQVNVHGGGCILGHPIGASGARILVTLIHALHQRGQKKGIASLCIGGGEATALAIEINDA